MELLKSLNEKIAFRKQRSHRIEELSDGVFAIVMTLLVLDIRVPLLELKTERAVWDSLVNAVPKISTFILSFSITGQFWSVFINQFNHIHASDRNETVIAIFCLLPVSLLPFSTSFLSEHLWSRVAIGFYIFNVFIIVLMFTAHWLYAYHSGLVKAEGGQEHIIHKAIMKRARMIIVWYAMVAGVCFFSITLAFAGTILLQVVITFSSLIESILWSLTTKYRTSVKNSPGRIPAPLEVEP